MKKIVLVFATLLLCFNVFAEEATEEVIEFFADKMSGVTAEGSDYTKLMGNARIKTSSMEISADVIELSGQDFRYIKAQGNVEGVHNQEAMEFSCQEMAYDRIEKIARFTEKVHLVDTENDVTADAERIEYREQDGLALMQINVKLVQKENLCTCAFATYKKNLQLLEMTGNPQITRGQDVFRAQEISFNMETDAITLDGRVSGQVTESSEKKDGEGEL